MLLLNNPHRKIVSSRMTEPSEKQIVIPKPPPVFLISALCLPAPLPTSPLYGSRCWSTWVIEVMAVRKSWDPGHWGFGEEEGKWYLLSSPEFPSQWVQVYEIFPSALWESVQHLGSPKAPASCLGHQGIQTVISAHYLNIIFCVSEHGIWSQRCQMPPKHSNHWNR